MVSVRQRYHSQVSSSHKSVISHHYQVSALTVIAGLKFWAQSGSNMLHIGHIWEFVRSDSDLFAKGLFKISFLFILMNGKLILKVTEPKCTEPDLEKNLNVIPFWG